MHIQDLFLAQPDVSFASCLHLLDHFPPVLSAQSPTQSCFHSTTVPLRCRWNLVQSFNAKHCGPSPDPAKIGHRHITWPNAAFGWYCPGQLLLPLCCMFIFPSPLSSHWLQAATRNGNRMWALRLFWSLALRFDVTPTSVHTNAARLVSCLVIPHHVLVYVTARTNYTRPASTLALRVLQI
jgi:hypothetical protein